MDIQWIIDDKYSSYRIVETESILQLKEWIQNNNYKYKVTVTVTHCDPYFWLTKAERSSLKGPIGLMGPCGLHGDMGVCGPTTAEEVKNSEKSRPILDKKYIKINIEFIMSNANAEKIWNTKLLTTNNDIGEAYPTWTVTKLRKSIPYTCGIYKREHFDEAFNALKLLKSNITEENFAKDDDGCWDPEMVECRLFDGMEKCLKTETHHESIETGESRVLLSVLEIDLLNNLEYIKRILSAYI